MRVLFYIQLLIVILVVFHLFTQNQELLILILLSIIAQAIVLFRYLQALVILFILFHLMFLGLMNLPIVWFIFATIYLLISLLLATLLNNATLLFSNSFRYSSSVFNESKNRSKNPHKIFVDLMRAKEKEKNSKSKSSSNSKKTTFTRKKEGSKSSKNDSNIQDAEFSEK